jgi:hypothetical protein
MSASFAIVPTFPRTWLSAPGLGLKNVAVWHNEHPLTTVPAGVNPATGRRLNDLDRQMIADSAIPRSVHSNLMAGLRKDLSAILELSLNRGEIVLQARRLTCAVAEARVGCWFRAS